MIFKQATDFFEHAARILSSELLCCTQRVIGPTMNKCFVSIIRRSYGHRKRDTNVANLVVILSYTLIPLEVHPDQVEVLTYPLGNEHVDQVMNMSYEKVLKA
eukprot:3553729-Pleurochrysis_carterae.AAC.2